jgi:hypothetical protein
MSNHTIFGAGLAAILIAKRWEKCMLAIHWIAIRRDGARGLVEQMTFPGDHLPDAMTHARAIFDQVRATHLDGPPNRFIVLDDHGREIGR